MTIQDKSSLNLLLAALRDVCLQQGLEKTYWVAYSGGLDSTVLLSLCAALRADLSLKLHAIHINHGVSSNAAAWAKHCAAVCEQYEIDYIERTIRVDVSAGDSFEEVARNERYAIFSGYLQEGDVLLTAHQQDDQAETVLLQLVRGSGPKGLSAMPLSKSFARGFHLRPLLPFPRSVLKAYAEEYQLSWIDDESNHNTKLTRNFIRHEIMPLLKSRWPTVINAISRSAAHCAESQVLLEECVLKDYVNVKGSRDNTLSVKKLLQLDSARQRWLLRKWIEQLGHPLPDARKIETIRHNVFTAQWDRMPCIRWEKTELRRYRDDLYLMPPLQKHDVQQAFTWDLHEPLYLPSIGTIQAEAVKGRGLRADVVKEVSIQFRRGGEKVDITGRGKHTLKNLFQEWDVLPWERDRIPLIFVVEKLVGVMGYFIDLAYAAKDDEAGYEFAVVK